MTGSDFGNPTPQFGTAEYAPKAGTDVCQSCNQTITGQYYRINGSLACAQCTEQLKNQIPKDNHRVFVRGLAFGFGGAILGLILYSTFSIVTGLEIGYVSLAVGWIIAKAIMMGSKGTGGRRYQIAAAALTYGAVSMAALPVYFSQVREEKLAKQTQMAPSGNPAPAPSSPEAAASDPGAASQPSSAHKPRMSLANAVGLLVLVGLASPFLELQNPLNGALGLLILFNGFNIASRLTAVPKIDVRGPFTAGT